MIGTSNKTACSQFFAYEIDFIYSFPVIPIALIVYYQLCRTSSPVHSIMTILYHIKAVAANPFTILRSTLRAYAIKKMAIRLSDFFKFLIDDLIDLISNSINK